MRYGSKETKSNKVVAAEVCLNIATLPPFAHPQCPVHSIQGIRYNTTILVGIHVLPPFSITRKETGMHPSPTYRALAEKVIKTEKWQEVAVPDSLYPLLAHIYTGSRISNDRGNGVLSSSWSISMRHHCTLAP